jgi:hypothetical protein
MLLGLQKGNDKIYFIRDNPIPFFMSENFSITQPTSVIIGQPVTESKNCFRNVKNSHQPVGESKAGSDDKKIETSSKPFFSRSVSWLNPFTFNSEKIAQAEVRFSKELDKYLVKGQPQTQPNPQGVAQSSPAIQKIAFGESVDPQDANAVKQEDAQKAVDPNPQAQGVKFMKAHKSVMDGIGSNRSADEISADKKVMADMVKAGIGLGKEVRSAMRGTVLRDSQDLRVFTPQAKEKFIAFGKAAASVLLKGQKDQSLTYEEIKDLVSAMPQGIGMIDSKNNQPMVLNRDQAEAYWFLHISMEFYMESLAPQKEKAAPLDQIVQGAQSNFQSPAGAYRSSGEAKPQGLTAGKRLHDSGSNAIQSGSAIFQSGANVTESAKEAIEKAKADFDLIISDLRADTVMDKKALESLLNAARSLARDISSMIDLMNPLHSDNQELMKSNVIEVLNAVRSDLDQIVIPDDEELKVINQEQKLSLIAASQKLSKPLSVMNEMLKYEAARAILYDKDSTEKQIKVSFNSLCEEYEKTTRQENQDTSNNDLITIKSNTLWKLIREYENKNTELKYIVKANELKA